MDYKLILLSGNCSSTILFGNNRIPGPVDNIETYSDIVVDGLLNGTYLDFFKESPIESKREKDFKEDSDIEYLYSFGKVLHNNPHTDKFMQIQKERYASLKQSIDDDTVILVVILNVNDLDKNNNMTDRIKNTVSVLKKYNLLHKTLFIEENIPSRNRLRLWRLVTNDFKDFAKKNNLYHIIIDENYDGKIMSNVELRRELNLKIENCGILKWKS